MVTDFSHNAEFGVGVAEYRDVYEPAIKIPAPHESKTTVKE